MNDSLELIAEEISNCTKCPLYRDACMGVPGEGKSNARIMFIGQAPGAEEDKTGRPFIGRSGKFLTAELTRIGIDRKDVFITSTCKHFPPKNREPTDEEIDACRPYLLRQITLINPKIIVLVGKTAQTLIGHSILEGRTVVPVVHPSAAMRFTKMRDRFRADFDRLKNLSA